MAYSHSFSSSFYVQEGDDELEPADFLHGREPVTVYQAILAMDEDSYQEMCREVFGRESVDLDEIMTKIQETDTVGTLSSPVDVWIDEEGYFSVQVYDERY